MIIFIIRIFKLSVIYQGVCKRTIQKKYAFLACLKKRVLIIVHGFGSNLYDFFSSQSFAFYVKYHFQLHHNDLVGKI